MKGIVKETDEDFIYPPTIEDEISRLRKENDNYRLDNIYKLFFATNRKAGEIADALNDAELTLKSDDKVFDRFIKLMEKIEPIFKSLASLRQDYLKIGEDDIENEAKNKAKPLIELRAEKAAKKGK